MKEDWWCSLVHKKVAGNVFCQMFDAFEVPPHIVTFFFLNARMYKVSVSIP